MLSLNMFFKNKIFMLVHVLGWASMQWHRTRVEEQGLAGRNPEVPAQCREGSHWDADTAGGRSWPAFPADPRQRQRCGQQFSPGAPVEPGATSALEGEHCFWTFPQQNSVTYLVWVD